MQLCRSLQFRGAYLNYIAVETDEKRIGAAVIIKYWMTASAVKRLAIAWSSMCSLSCAEVTALLYALEHARDIAQDSTRVHSSDESRCADSHREGSQSKG